MKKTFILLLGILIAMPTFAVQVNTTPKRTGSASRSMVGTLHLTDKKSSLKFDKTLPGTNNNAKPEPEPEPEPEPDNRDAERNACLANNIGVGNTFVWASKFSNTSNYSSMIEDVEHPENNVCFVRVELRSFDPSVRLSDMGAKYFPTQTTVNCGSWVNKSDLEKRILDAKKSGRVWATIGGSMGGAGIGVGSMELFGNKLLDKAGLNSVQGQKSEAVSKTDMFIIQLKEKKDNSAYEQVVELLKTMKKLCKDNQNSNCSKIEYETILKGISEN